MHERDRVLLHVAKIIHYFSKPQPFVKALCGTHMKDYYAVHFKYFLLCSCFLISASSWMGSASEKAERKTRWAVYKGPCGVAEQDSIPELEGLETLPLATGSNSSSKD